MRYFALAAAACVATAAVAQPMAARIADRQANYKQMGAAMKAINDQLRSGNPSVREIRRRSALIAGFSVRLLRWFPRGSGPEAGARTRALPAIWTDHDSFTRRGAALVVAARRLDAAARGGDLVSIRAALPAVSRACSACHDDFRAPEH